MHLPIPTLVAGGFGGLGGGQGVAMDLGEGEVAEVEGDFAIVIFEKLLDDGVGRAAGRALEVAEVLSPTGGGPEVSRLARTNRPIMPPAMATRIPMRILDSRDTARFLLIQI
jgi:hypothetical protein